jgi:electron transfer flavoprotein alpha subunit
MFRRVLLQQVARQQQWRRHASVLVVADHNNKKLSAATLSTVTAGSKLGDVVVLVAGKAANAVGAAAAKVKGVKKVLHADDAQYEHALPENLAPLVRNPAISIYMYFSFVFFQKKKDCFFA